MDRSIHPITIISAYKRALDDAVRLIAEIANPIDLDNVEEMMKLIKATVNTKFINQWSDKMCAMALDAVRKVAMTVDGKMEVDIKRYARVEKVNNLHPLHLFCENRFTKRLLLLI